MVGDLGDQAPATFSTEMFLVPHIAFILGSTKLGPMIFNRFDVTEPKPGFQVGVGAQLMYFGDFDEVAGIATSELLEVRRAVYGSGVVVLDVGANIGAHTLRWAKYMEGWGSVQAFEPQERVFYALAGNIALNNCFNASAMHAGVGIKADVISVPVLKSNEWGNFGGFQMKRADPDNGEYLDDRSEVRVVSIDSLALPRVDFIKIDVEGMELDVIAGARATLDKHRPAIYAEHAITGLDRIKSALPGYTFICAKNDDDNVLCIHKDDKILDFIKQ